jgi:hypothetical protein
MYSKLLIIVLIIFSQLCSSCFEKDKKVPPYPGDVLTISDNIETYQSYFDFETGKVIKTSLANAWQLGFECGATGWHILVNSGAQWLIYNTKQTSLDSFPTPPLNANWKYDIQSDYPDSTAVGNWFMKDGNVNTYPKNVYILGKYSGSGYTELKQLVFLEVNDSQYKFYYHEASPENSDTVTISKTDSVNFVYFSFPDRKQVNLEPDKSKYDIVFGPYYDLATEFGVTIPYLVRGVLLNITDTKAILDSLDTYNQIDIQTLDKLTFSNRRDEIGYRWKVVNVNVSNGSGSYSLKGNYSYILQTAQGNNFKMHFLGYELNGNNGFPQFEYLQLK